MSKVSYDGLDYFQGYFDCLRNITSHITALEDRMKEGYLPTGNDIMGLRKDAREWEVGMWKQLKEKHGDGFKNNGFGKYEIVGKKPIYQCMHCGFTTNEDSKGLCSQCRYYEMELVDFEKTS